MKTAKRVYVALVYLFLYLPIIVLVVYSFNDSRVATSWRGFTLRWYKVLVNNDELVGAAVNSLTVGVLAATIATVIGTLAAVAFYRYRFRGRNLLVSAMYVVTVQPDIVMGISLLVFFVAVHLPLGFVSLLIAHVTFCLPFVAITVAGRLKGFDAHVIEAAQDLGAGEYEIFSRIIVPMAFPAVAAGWLLSFTLSLDDVLVSFFVTGPGFEILPLKIYSMVKLGVKPQVNALSAVLLLVTFAAVLGSQRLVTRPGMARERRGK